MNYLLVDYFGCIVFEGTRKAIYKRMEEKGKVWGIKVKNNKQLEDLGFHLERRIGTGSFLEEKKIGDIATP